MTPGLQTPSVRPATDTEEDGAVLRDARDRLEAALTVAGQATRRIFRDAGFPPSATTKATKTLTAAAGAGAAMLARVRTASAAERAAETFAYEREMPPFVRVETLTAAEAAARICDDLVTATFSALAEGRLMLPSDNALRRAGYPGVSDDDLATWAEAERRARHAETGGVDAEDAVKLRADADRRRAAIRAAVLGVGAPSPRTGEAAALLVLADTMGGDNPLEPDEVPAALKQVFEPVAVALYPPGAE